MSSVFDGRREAQRLAALYGPPQKRNPPLTRRASGKFAVERTSNIDPTSLSLPRNWRVRLPSPLAFYTDVMPDISITNGIGRGRCPLHTDTKRSFLVRLDGSKGTWACPACGTGDVVSFVMRLQGIDFVAAIRLLILGGQPASNEV